MRLVICILLGFVFSETFAQQTLPLYPEGSNISLASEATLTVYLPEGTASGGTSVLVIPGGGYGGLATNTEGTPIAEAFAKRGITAFVLKYRLPCQVGAKDRSTAPLQDAQQAIKLIRENADGWKIDPKKVGVIGFSAGGHLASQLETRFGKSELVDGGGISLRPDFAILVYPVITMEEKLTHMGSRMNLLGPDASKELVKLNSSEQQVTAATPPTYITHAADDGIVDVHNSILMYEALIGSKVNAELHLYPLGDHGFIQRLPVQEWLDPMLLWMRKLGY